MAGRRKISLVARVPYWRDGHEIRRGEIFRAAPVEALVLAHRRVAKLLKRPANIRPEAFAQLVELDYLHDALMTAAVPSSSPEPMPDQVEPSSQDEGSVTGEALTQGHEAQDEAPESEPRRRRYKRRDLEPEA